MNVTKSPILDALNAESYAWLSTQCPELLTAIETEIANGRSPEAIARLVAAHVGSERQALATRCFQAASYIQRNMERVR